MPVIPPSTSLASRLAALGPGRIDVHTHAFDPDLPDIGASHEGTFPVARRLSADRAQIILGGRMYPLTLEGLGEAMAHLSKGAPRRK